MMVRSLLTAALTLAFAAPAVAGPFHSPAYGKFTNVGWRAPHHGPLSAVPPPPGPIVLQPAYAAEWGPIPLGVYHRMTPVSKVCRFSHSYEARCWLRHSEPIGKDCGCPPPFPGSPWVFGTVSSR